MPDAKELKTSENTSSYCPSYLNLLLYIYITVAKEVNKPKLAKLIGDMQLRQLDHLKKLMKPLIAVSL